MTRFSSSANQAAASGMHVPYICACDFEFPSGHLRANSSDHKYTIGGYDYLPFGSLANISSVVETSDLTPAPVEFTLSGVDNSLVTTVLAEKYHGHSASIYIGYLDKDFQLVDTPFLLWEGDMDTMTLKTGEGTSQISLIAENRLIRWAKIAGWLYTVEHQQALMGPNDNFFDQTSANANQVIKWADQSVGTGFNRFNNPYWFPHW